ncbi:MAG: hypothetical protein F4099_05735 [Synechococcus sp. SB0673_bin_10]|nr:hypothetical protein [Synechococcus sp. SB0673_bin_10]
MPHALTDDLHHPCIQPLQSQGPASSQGCPFGSDDTLGSVAAALVGADCGGDHHHRLGHHLGHWRHGRVPVCQG